MELEEEGRGRARRQGKGAVSAKGKGAWNVRVAKGLGRTRRTATCLSVGSASIARDSAS